MRVSTIAVAVALLLASTIAMVQAAEQEMVVDDAGSQTQQQQKDEPASCTHPMKGFWEHILPIQGNDAAATSVPPPRFAHAACSSIENRGIMFIHGGITMEESGARKTTPYDDLWQYDELANSWTRIETTGEVPSPRLHHSLVAVKGVALGNPDLDEDRKKMFLVLFGGFNDFFTAQRHRALQDLYILDLETKVWRRLDNEFADVMKTVFPSARGGHQAVFSPDGGNMFVFGGAPAISAPRDFHEVWKFNFVRMEWENTTPENVEELIKGERWPEGRLGFSMAQIGDPGVGRVFHIFGGACKSKHQCNDEWELDVAPASRPGGPVKFTKIVHDGPGAGAGGDAAQGGGNVDDDDTGVPAPRRAANADVVIGKLLFLFGGLSFRGEVGGSFPPKDIKIFGDMNVYNWEERRWIYVEEDDDSSSDDNADKKKKKKAAPLSYALAAACEGVVPPPTFGHTVTALNDKVVIFGGRAGSMKSPGSNSVWEFSYQKWLDSK